MTGMNTTAGGAGTTGWGFDPEPCCACGKMCEGGMCPKCEDALAAYEEARDRMRMFDSYFTDYRCERCKDHAWGSKPDGTMLCRGCFLVPVIDPPTRVPYAS